MALTMTRTRTQTTLNRLSQMIANVHGELATIDRLVSLETSSDTTTKALLNQRAQREQDKAALYATLIQFDPELDPLRIRLSDEWMRVYGRPGTAAALEKYVADIVKHFSSLSGSAGDVPPSNALP